MDEWEKLKIELSLYQKEKNSVWYTDKPLFCSFTNRQISKGIAIATKTNLVGICSIKYFIEKESYKLFNNNEFVYMVGIESNSPPIRKTVKKERALVTDGFRYKILKRDNFKCKACGKSASEVELQIDHIIPVSKGGKTIESNLQALCKKCNSGKSNKH